MVRIIAPTIIIHVDAVLDGELDRYRSYLRQRKKRMKSNHQQEK
jgi:hypothetical protein